MAYRVIAPACLLLLAAAGAAAKEWKIEVREERLVPALESFAAKLAPGDVVRFEPAGATIRGEIKLKDAFGVPEAPLVIDGNGCTFLGSEPLNPGEWSAVADGLYKSEGVVSRLKLSQNLLLRFYLIFDGRPQRMGRVSKGSQAPFLSPEALQPQQWTYAAAEKALYIRLEPGQKIEEARIEIPERQSGVALGGTKTAHLELRNMKVRHFINDGFNIHGRSEAVKFVDIAAVECGDDGLSAHEECSVEATRFTAEGNATGFCNVNNSSFVASDVTLVNNLAYEIYVTDSSRNRVENLRVTSRAPRLITVRGSDKGEGICELYLARADVKGRGPVSVEQRSRFAADQLFIESGPWTINGAARVVNSSLVAGKLAIQGEWTGEGNTLKFTSIEDRGRQMSAAEFSAAQAKPSESSWKEAAP